MDKEKDKEAYDITIAESNFNTDNSVKDIKKSKTKNLADEKIQERQEAERFKKNSKTKAVMSKEEIIKNDLVKALKKEAVVITKHATEELRQAEIKEKALDILKTRDSTYCLRAVTYYFMDDKKTANRIINGSNSSPFAHGELTEYTKI